MKLIDNNFRKGLMYGILTGAITALLFIIFK